MIGRLSRFMTRVVSRWLPDPLIFAMLLTLLTFGIALWLTPQTPISMVKFWGDGFWNLLAFGMQMALIIVTGHALASSGPVKSLLRAAASAAKTPVQGVMLVTFFGSVACVINWGFGLVVGAMFAREVARRVPGSDYPLLIACAYIGFLTWGGGFSGSMPLLAATPGQPGRTYCGLNPGQRYPAHRIQHLHHARAYRGNAVYHPHDDAKTVRCNQHRSETAAGRGRFSEETAG